MMVMPYLSFTGKCEEAFTWYAGVFGGKVQHLSRYGDIPAGGDQEEQKRLVMHAELGFPEGGGLSGADATWPVAEGSAVSIHVHFESAARARVVFEALCEGGSAVAPLQPNPPPDDGGMSGMVSDKYGFTWIVSCLI